MDDPLERYRPRAVSESPGGEFFVDYACLCDILGDARRMDFAVIGFDGFDPRPDGTFVARLDWICDQTRSDVHPREPTWPAFRDRCNAQCRAFAERISADCKWYLPVLMTPDEFGTRK